ncbi:unnamed protein product [Ambrosiozyma monospora]|uniref:Unnamed protein product n=1 Tax=Ambrosiozyma monospora TaxID=43982 RepID=A0A9W6YX32_AMBMO|nr:unnamed protein product [Ambrosiozyma monospora]
MQLLPLLTAFLSISQLATCLNILILGNGPFGNQNAKILHNYLSLNPNNTVISVLPLHQHSSFSSEIFVEDHPLLEEDLFENSDEDDSMIDTGELLHLEVGDHYYSEKLDNMWYVNGSPLFSSLFALDFVLPKKYTDLDSIDLIIIGPDEDNTLGLFDQYTKVTSQMMKLALLRNIPTMHISGLPYSQMTDLFDDNGLDSSNAEYLEALRNLENMITELSETTTFKQTHNFHTSRSMKVSSLLDTYKMNEHKNNNNRLLPNGVGLNVNFNIHENGKCTHPTSPFMFLQTRSVRGYNKILSLTHDDSIDSFQLDEIYNIDDNLSSHSNGIYLSEFTAEDKNCVISVTPISWNGDDYEEVEFLDEIFNKLNEEVSIAPSEERFLEANLKLVSQS